MLWDDRDSLWRGDSSLYNLPKHCLLGVWSACQVGLIWASSPVRNVFRHSNLVIRDAGALMPLGEAVDLLRRGLRVQHCRIWCVVLAMLDHDANPAVAVGWSMSTQFGLGLTGFAQVPLAMSSLPCMHDTPPGERGRALLEDELGQKT